MHNSYTLEEMASMINGQAIEKKWKRESLFCIKRAHHELDEMKKAIENNLSQEEIAEEGIDVEYFLLQAMLDAAPTIPPSVAFKKKYDSNWIHKKKTEDEEGNVIRR